MAEVDFERAWYVLKGRLPEKRSWGTAQLHELMGEIEVGCLSTETGELMPGELLAARRPHARDDETIEADEPSTQAAA